MRTVQQIVDQARVPLNDTDKVRYTDATLLLYFNDAVLLCRKIRPDLFIGRYKNPPTALALLDDFPVDEMYAPLFADYVTGRAESIDDEHVSDTRASMFLQIFVGGLKT